MDKPKESSGGLLKLGLPIDTNIDFERGSNAILVKRLTRREEGGGRGI